MTLEDLDKLSRQEVINLAAEHGIRHEDHDRNQNTLKAAIVKAAKLRTVAAEQSAAEEAAPAADPEPAPQADSAVVDTEPSEDAAEEAAPAADPEPAPQADSAAADPED